MSHQLANRLQGVSESATLKLNATVQALKAKGIDVVNLTAGEPDFSPPEESKDAVRNAVDRNQSKYTPAPGIPELREAVAQKTNHQQPEVADKNPWKATNVVVTNGGKQALFNSFLALLNPGDEVLIPAPFWLSYPEMVKIAGGVPRVIPSGFEQKFKITPDQLRKALTPKVKMLILNSPNNPSGVMYSQEEFRALADILVSEPLAQQLWVISDEIYDRIILGNIRFCSFLKAAPELASRTITINGVSKSAAMTGWRVGWSVAPEWVTQGMITLQGQSTSGVNSLAQWAALASLKLPESHFGSQIKTFQSRCQLVIKKLQNNRSLDIFSPDGAFYVFVGIKKFLRTGEDSVTFAQRLLEEAKVAVIPGTPFGESGFIRLSFATDEKTLEEGCDRILKYLQ